MPHTPSSPDLARSPVSELTLEPVRAALTQPRADAFAQLGPAFLTRLPATPLPAPYVAGFSTEVAALLGLDPALAQAPGFAEFFCGNTTREWPASALPYASVYSGHQFGVWAGQLGDGRALSLGELAHDGQRHELQLKGAGRTPYSRMGDGRAVLRSSIREFLGSEALHHLGIPTTRALCLIGSDQTVWRETQESTAVLTRVAPSFVRFGHFEHFAANDLPHALRSLADHAIARFYPHCAAADDPYLALLEAIVQVTAVLLAQWQSVGFCHGVMNTDNLSLLGLTLDYGPFGLMDGFDAGFICNHSDTQGRYAYRMQPQVAYWNLFRLAQAFLPLLGMSYPAVQRRERAVADAQAVLEGFRVRFTDALAARMQAKLGLETTQPGDAALVERLLDIMQASHADFTLTFRHLSRITRAAPVEASADAPVRDLFVDRAACDAWLGAYRARLASETRDDAARAQAMNQVNPRYVLRNHLAQTAISRAQEKDFSEIERLAAVLRRPFDEQPEHAAYAALPPVWAATLSVSCSS
ncbi:protein adenylyltransferase SelO [Paraburkholderia hayleyella]|uniref:protein adenylyltransferase SelO n=1 Tax=Paraburkholderia hayleyella TaxID=2152889 RepID=UPI001290EF9C|nr:YdiU family protein [Paraburkholderia hayleyella]